MVRVMTVEESQRLRQRIMLWGQKIKDLMGRRNTFGDIVKVEDHILAWEGSPEDIKAGTAKLLFISKGHIVNQGLISIVNTISAASLSTCFSCNFTTGMQYAYIRVGTGGSVTTGSTNALTSAVATAASSQAGALTNPSGSYRISWTATWNAGTLSEITITELGLFLNINTSLKTLGTFGAAIAAQSGAALFSRLSEADSDFTGFLVNTAVPLTIEWRLTLSFA